MTTHHLKTWPAYFAAVLDGSKPFEVRTIADRVFAVGDTLILEEYDIEALERSRAFLRLAGTHHTDAQAVAHLASFYTGRSLHRRVTYVLPGVAWQGAAAVVMGLGEVEG